MCGSTRRRISSYLQKHKCSKNGQELCRTHTRTRTSTLDSGQLSGAAGRKKGRGQQKKIGRKNNRIAAQVTASYGKGATYHNTQTGLDCMRLAGPARRKREARSLVHREGKKATPLFWAMERVRVASQLHSMNVRLPGCRWDAACLGV